MNKTDPQKYLSTSSVLHSWTLRHPVAQWLDVLDSDRQMLPVGHRVPTGGFLAAGGKMRPRGVGMIDAIWHSLTLERFSEPSCEEDCWP